MSTTTTTPVLPAELIGKLAAAYGDSDSALAARAVAVDAALAFGADVRSIARDMADANRANPAVPVVTPATLGYAKFAGTVAAMVGTDLRAMVRRDKKLVADVIRAGKRAGLKVATARMREALHGVDGPFAREEIVGEVVEALLSTVLPAPAPASPRSAAGQSLASEPASSADAAPARGEMTGPDALAMVRAVTAWLNMGGAYSADLGSAMAELTSAVTASRKRGQNATAKLRGLSTETVAA